MMHKRLSSDKLVLIITPILFLLVTAVFPVVQWNTNVSRQWSNELQRLEAQKLWLVRALNTLKDHQHVTQALSVSVKSRAQLIDSITLSLIEAIKHQALTERLELTQLTVTQSDDPQVASETNESSIHSLRVSFAATTDRAVSLLSLFDALSDAAGWRPTEVRGCSVIRLADAPVSLHATCSVDVYYFPKVHT